MTFFDYYPDKISKIDIPEGNKLTLQTFIVALEQLTKKSIDFDTILLEGTCLRSFFSPRKLNIL